MRLAPPSVLLLACLAGRALGCVHDTGALALPKPEPLPFAALPSAATRDVLFSAMSPAKARANLQFLTQSAHLAGSEQDHRLGAWVAKQFERARADSVQIEAVPALLCFPAARPRVWAAAADGTLAFELALEEAVVAGDVTSNASQRRQPFNGYSPSAAVAGKLVYANFGRCVATPTPGPDPRAPGPDPPAQP
jgi:hypothetical protein